MSTYVINDGHCNKGNYDGGAVGNGFREQDLTRIVGNLVRQKLKVLGHTVINATVDSASSVGNALAKICNIEKSVNADIFVSIHLNAFNKLGHGTEVFTYGGKEIPQARNILNNIIALGYTNRGIKDGSKLYVVHNTNAIGFLVELCFIDNVEDMKKFDADKMADAIVKGLCVKSVNVTPVIVATPVKSSGNPNVLAMQKLCNQLGIRDKNGDKLIEDSYNGSLTESACSKLPVCGIKYTQPVITKVVQKITGCSVDGVFWAGTEISMKAWQKSHNCKKDGVCGKESYLSFLK